LGVLRELEKKEIASASREKNVKSRDQKGNFKGGGNHDDGTER